MNMHEQQQEHIGKKKRLKIFALIGGSILVVVLLLFFGIPLFLSSAGGKNFVVNRINSSVDGKVQMDDLSIGWFKGVRVENMTFDDKEGNTSVQVKSLKTQPQILPLLGGNVKLGKTYVENPRVYLKVSPEKLKEAKEEKEKPEKDKEGFEMPVDQIDLEVVNGQAIIETLGERPAKVSFTNIASNVVISETAQPSKLAVSMQVQDGETPGTISANGTAETQDKGWTIKDGKFDVKISKLQLASLKPLFALAGQDMDMAGELNADATAQITDNKIQNLTANAVVTDFAQGTGAQRTVFAAPVKLTAQAAQEGETIRIDKLNLESGFLVLNSNGTLNNFNYDVKANLAETQKFVGQFADLSGLAMQGTVALNGNVGMDDKAITFTSKGGAQQLVITKNGTKTPQTDAQLDVEGSYLKENKELRMPSANLNSTPASIAVSDLVLPLAKTDEPKKVSANAQMQADLAKVWPFVQVFATTPEGMNLAGQMNAGVKVDTAGNQIHIVTQDAAITGLRISQPNTEPFVQERVSLKADILMDTEDKTVDIRALNLQGAQGQQLIEVTKGTVEKTISQNSTSLKGDFQAAVDLKALTSFASAFMPEGLTMEGQRKFFFNFITEYPNDKPELKLANLNGKGQVGFDSANFMGLKFGPTDFNVNIQKGLALLELPDAKVNEGILRLAATVNLADPKRMLQLTKPMKVLDNIHLDDELTRNLLIYLNPMFANQTNLTGIASLECSKLSLPLVSPMDKAAILLDATVAMSDVNLKPTGMVGQVLTLVDKRSSYKAELKPTQLLMNKGTLQYKNMEFVLEEYPIGFSGQIFLAKAEPSADLTVAVPYTIQGKTVHVTDDLSTRFSARLKGPLSSLKLDLGSMLQQGLQKGIEEEIKKQIPGLQDIFK